MMANPKTEPHLDADQLNAFAEGALSASERAICLQHLAECAHCREIAFLAGASLPSEEPALATARGIRIFWWPIFSLGAAALAAAVMAVLFLHHTHQNVPPQTVLMARNPSSPASPPAAPLAETTQPAANQPETNQTALNESRKKPAPKPSPALKPPPASPAAMDNAAFGGLKAADSAVASAAPAASVPQELAGSNKSTLGFSAGAGAAAASPPQAQSAARASQSAPQAQAGTMQTYKALLRSPAGSAQVAGTITDSSGAAIAHAKVTLDQTSGATHRETLTDNSGHFSIASLQPGKYQLEISSPGFISQIREVDLDPTQLAQLDSKLAVGSVSETVAVQAGVAAMDTESASVPSTLPGKEPLQTTVTSGKRTLALDTTGKLFLSKKAGKQWKAAHGPWKTSPITSLSLTPDQQFKVTAAEGSWLSPDGEHWHPAT